MPVGHGWQHEVKFDGYRVQIHKSGAYWAEAVGTRKSSVNETLTQVSGIKNISWNRGLALALIAI